ncbi:MAG: GNAT family N-acetyltransferase [Verrucomicrobiota bacterium]
MNTPQWHCLEGPDCPTLPLAAGMDSPAPLATPAEHPDARVFLTNKAGALAGCAALWWSATPRLAGARVGAIGGFAALDGDGAKVLLDGAERTLRGQGCEVVVGPMNGNTWRRHRWVIESDGRGPYLLEPRNPPAYPGWWQQAGYEVLARYTSSVVLLGPGPTVRTEVGERLARSGIGIRTIDPSRYDEELRAIHALSLKSFTNNFLYTPLDEEAFLESYRKLRERVDRELVLIAERDGQICGFLFGVEDFEALARGEHPALIVKTLAVDPAVRGAGLGAFMIDKLHQTGGPKGYREAIHAMQHESNSSLRITGRHGGRVFRSYALWSKRL